MCWFQIIWERNKLLIWDIYTKLSENINFGMGWKDIFVSWVNTMGVEAGKRKSEAISGFIRN